MFRELAISLIAAALVADAQTLSRKIDFPQDSPLTVMMYGRMREGASPVLNAVSLFLMVASAVLALTFARRRA